MKRRRVRAVLLLMPVVLLAVLLSRATPAPAAAGQTFTATFSQLTGFTPQYYGGGLLHGINPREPSEANLNPLHIYLWRLGEPGFLTNLNPPYDYFHIYPTVAVYGPREVEAIASDFKNEYPGAGFQTLCQSVAGRAVTNGWHPEWDLLNEPDSSGWTYLSTDPTTNNWDQCYQGIKAADPTALIAGPSISSANLTTVEQFLLNQKQVGMLPDVVTWHFSTPEGLESDVTTIKNFMASNGISARPIVVQEVMFAASVPHPGQAVAYFAASERAQVPLGHACWNETAPPNNNTCEQPMLDGILDNNGNRRGQWYAYADLSAMSGNLVTTTTSNKSYLDGLASYTSSQATVLFGANDNWGGGTVTLNLNGLGSLPFLPGASGQVRVVVQRIPAGTAPATQTITSNQIYTYSAGTLSLSVSTTKYEAERITVLSSTSDISDPNWESLGGLLTESPTISSQGANQLDTFVRGQDAALYQRTWNGSTWSAWGASLGGPTGGTFTGKPAAVSWGTGNITVAVRGTDDAVYTRTWTSGTWSAWQSLGGTTTGSPAIATQGANKLDVFMRGSDGALYENSYNGSTWSGWGSSLGGPTGGTFTGTPAAVSWGTGNITIAVRGTDNVAYTRTWTSGTWSTWQSLGGTLTSSPAISTQGVNKLDVFVRSTDGALYQDAYTGTWSGFTKVGGPTSGTFTGAPSAVSWGLNRTDVVVWSDDGPLYHSARTGA